MKQSTLPVKQYLYAGAEAGFPPVRSFGYHHHRRAVSLPPHRHPGGIEITFVLSGSAVWQVAGGESFLQTGNTLFIMPAGLSHLGKYDIITPCELAWLILDARHLHKVFDPENAEEFQRLTAEFSCRNIPFSKPFKAILRSSIETLRREDQPFRELRLNHLLPLLLIELLIRLKTPDREDSRIFPETEQFIRENLPRRISCAELAANCHLSESYFWTRFKRESGLTPMDFLNRKRLEKAESLLKNSSHSITKIAFDCGFQSSQYFATVFKKQFGLTPTQLRKKLGGTAGHLLPVSTRFEEKG